MYFADDSNMLEVIRYCYDHNVCDMITVYDEYKDEFYIHNNFIKGTGFVKYYIMNKQIEEIHKEKNGLVTI